jgi:hypothetical protein
MMENGRTDIGRIVLYRLSHVEAMQEDGTSGQHDLDPFMSRSEL